MRSTRLRSALVLAALIAMPAPALIAQEAPGRFVGRVVDHDSGKPLEGARVTFRDTELAAVTDNQGAFLIRNIPAGLHAVQVELLGYETRGGPVRILPGQTMEALIRLATKPIELPPIDVSVRSPRLESVGFYVRRDETGSQGRFITRDIIEKRNPQLLTDLFYNQHGLRVTYGGAGVRYVTVNRGGGCTPMFYIDGVRGDNSNFDVVRPETIEGIEIYVGAVLPIQYQSSTDCGVIVVWTRRGSRS
jgi:iron complex outermembrane receptor protein